MQYSYVVTYDDVNDEFTMDYETQDEKFNGKPLFDADSNQWVRLEENHWADDGTTYNRAADTLYRVVSLLSLETEEE